MHFADAITTFPYSNRHHQHCGIKQQEIKRSPHLDQIVLPLSIQCSETEATSDLWCLAVFAIIQDGFSVGRSSEEDGVDKAGVSLQLHHPACFGQIIQACVQTTRQGFVLSLEESDC